MPRTAARGLRLPADQREDMPEPCMSSKAANLYRDRKRTPRFPHPAVKEKSDGD